MRSIKLVLFVACVALLSGCATFMRELATFNEQQPAQQKEQSYASPTYATPQVWQPEQSSTVHAYCNTIGNVTTCKEL